MTLIVVSDQSKLASMTMVMPSFQAKENPPKRVGWWRSLRQFTSQYQKISVPAAAVPSPVVT
ncbi:hypothetical protein D3C86_1124470 [compost metagenome]